MRKPLSQRFVKTSAFISKTNSKVSNFIDRLLPPSPYDRLAYGFVGIRDAPMRKPDPTRLPQTERKLSKEEQTRKELQGPMFQMLRGGTGPAIWLTEQFHKERRELERYISRNPPTSGGSGGGGAKSSNENNAIAAEIRKLEDEACRNRYEAKQREDRKKYDEKIKAYEAREAKEEGFHRKFCAVRCATSEHEQRELISSLYSDLTGQPNILSLYGRYRKELDSWFSAEQKREIRYRILDDSKMSFSEKKACLPKTGSDVFGLRYVRLFFHHMAHKDDILAAVVIPAVFIIGITGGIFGIRWINQQDEEKPVKAKSEAARSYEAESNSGKITQTEQPLPEIPAGQPAKVTARAHFERGVAYYNLEEYEKAITEFTRAMNLDRVRSEYFFWRADAYDKVGRYGWARIDRRTGEQWRSVLGNGF